MISGSSRNSSIAAAIIAVGALVLGTSSRAFAQDAGDETFPDHLPLMQPTTVEYRWVFLVPEWVVEPQTYRARVYGPTLRPGRIAYTLPEWTTERRKVGRVPDFSCKYSDLMLPNECRTTWRDVYVDVPIAVLRSDSFDVDVPEWSWQDVQTTVDVARLVWKEQTLVVSVPAFESAASAR